MTNKELNAYLNIVNAEYRRNPNSAKIHEISKKVLDEGTLDQVIRFVQIAKGVDIKKFGKVVASIGSAEQNFQMACMDGSDSRLHRDRIIALQDIDINLKAGKQINDQYREQYVNKHGAVVLKGTAHQNFNYLHHNKIKGLDRQAHLNRIIETKDVYINKKCAKEFKDADVRAHGQVILDSRSAFDNLLYAAYEGADVLAHLHMVRMYGGAYENFCVLQEFAECDKVAHLNAIFMSANVPKENEVKIDCIKWLKSNGLFKIYKDLPSVREFVQDYKDKKIQLESNIKSTTK